MRPRCGLNWCGGGCEACEEARRRRHPLTDAVTLCVALGMAVGLVLLLGLYVDVIQAGRG